MRTVDVGGLNTTSQVRLRDSLSNPNKQLKRLLAALDNGGGLANVQVNKGAVTELVAQTGAEDPASVRLTVKENRKLSPEEVAKLARQYEAGATARTSSSAVARWIGSVMRKSKTYGRRNHTA